MTGASPASRSQVLVVGTRRNLARRRVREYCRGTATLQITPVLRPGAEQRPVRFRRLLIAGALATGAAAILVTVGDPFTYQSLLSLLLGWSFLASGIVAWSRRPENHLGVLMVVIGLVWFVSQLLRQWVAPVPLTAGIWLGDLWLLPLAFLLAGFPLARLESGLDRVLVGALAVVMIPLELLWLMFLDFDDFGEGIPRNVLMVADRPGLADAIDTVQRVILITTLATLAYVLVRRFVRASAPLRRVLAPVLAGALGLALLAANYLLDKVGVRWITVYSTALLVLTTVPIIF